MYSHLILCHQNGNQYKPFEIEPIILSEEILLKCVFEKLNQSDMPAYRLIINRFVIFIDYQSLGFVYKINDVQVIEVEYLHHLQNLIHSLTGKELNTSGLIKDKV